MNYKDLIVWQKSMTLALLVYKLTKLYPMDEIYGLTSQMRRCAVSIPSNIAEGSRRKGKDAKHFLRISYGSGAELETQLLLSKNIGFCNEEKYLECEDILNEVMRMLNVMINK